MMGTRVSVRIFLFLFFAAQALASKEPSQASEAGTSVTVKLEVMEIEPVWAGHPVGFALLTQQGKQFAVYYNANRQMTIASRELNSRTWDIIRLPSLTEWDSHNYITMAADAEGCLHIAGNMHVAPLIYFRSTKPLDARSLEKVNVMVHEEEERRMTYPRFFHGPKGDLIYKHRDGSSGSGNDFYNVYSPSTRSWRRLLDTPLTAGKDQDINGYFSLPELGPDGYYHIRGVWRDTSDAATNHDISYARSRDLAHWETAAGKPLALPLTIHGIDIVDPVPAFGGLFGSSLGFDSQNRPILTYHKYDAGGNSQIYAARFEDGQWAIHQVSDWDGYRWDFGGGGSLPNTIGVGAVSRRADGRYVLGYRRPDGQNGVWELDEENLKAIGPAPALPDPKFNQLAALTLEAEKDFADWKQPDLQMKTASDSGTSGEEGVRYFLKWATLGANRDKPREGPLPQPTMLRLYKITEEKSQ